MASSLTTNMSGLTLGRPATGDQLSTHITPSIPPCISDEEAKLYYAGLPSKPVLVARTGTTPYQAPTGPEAYPKLKELRIVGDHEINEIWEDDLAFKVHAILGEKKVEWTSTDVVRIGHVKESSGNVILWIGVKPSSLSYEQGIDVAVQCKELLLDHDLNDVDVEIRESEVILSAGPLLLQPTFDIDPTVDVREPFTTTLGIPICAESTPWVEGTGGFFLDDGGDGKKLLLATARHVVFPQADNNLFERKSESQRRHNVLVFSEALFQQHLVSIQDQLKAQDVLIRYHTKRIEMVTGKEDDGAIAVREDAHIMLKKVKAKVKALAAFHQELSTHWATDNSRILGHVIFSPPIAVGTEQYTQDVAVIDIDTSKIDPSNFTGNVIDLGTKFPPDVLTAMMHPNSRNSHNFDYPGDRLLSLRGTITDDEMRKPTMYDQNNDPCIIVIKHGRATGLTVGRANNIMSYTRKCFDDNDSGIVKEWAILPFDSRSGAFSAKGDSGSVVVDGATHWRCPHRRWRHHGFL